MKKLILPILFGLIIGTACTPNGNASRDAAALSIDYNDIDYFIVEAYPIFFYNEHPYFFSKYDAVYLENTQDIDSRDVKKILPVSDDKVVLLANNRLLCYNYLSGKENKEFASRECDYVSADFIKDKAVYALACNGGKYSVRQVDTLGNIVEEIPLDNDYVYDNIILLDGTTALVSAETYPYPVTFKIEFKTRQVSQFDVPQKKNREYDKAFADTLKSTYELASLYNFTRGKNGEIIGKYLFDNTFYKYEPNGKTAMIDIQNRKSIKFKDNIHKRENRGKYLIPTGVIKLMDSAYVFMHQKEREVVWSDSKVIYKFYTLLDNNMQGVKDHPQYLPNLSFAWKHKYYGIHDIHAMQNVHFHPQERMVFQIRRASDPYYILLKSYLNERTLLPGHIKSTTPNNDLLLGYYQLREKNPFFMGHYTKL